MKKTGLFDACLEFFGITDKSDVDFLTSCYKKNRKANSELVKEYRKISSILISAINDAENKNKYYGQVLDCIKECKEYAQKNASYQAFVTYVSLIIALSYEFPEVYDFLTK